MACAQMGHKVSDSSHEGQFRAPAQNSKRTLITEAVLCVAGSEG